MKKKYLALIGALLAALSLTACSHTESSDSSEPTLAAGPTTNQDPREGFVSVWSKDLDYYIVKRCDDTTLVYQSEVKLGYSIAVIPNSPECTDDSQSDSAQ